ncbi:uncharacterized protein EV420DRAFT_1487281 [Desarmillaria tabescens]|uniref:Uncharacterized protein n=1 Tax=Armillaria tabescens TaxID=1929756 RepID=A0AA39J7X9_ARMTA|nr:uncharacterized protein EV420DRAFT_1487281 [Desarmillaria tabescens]KAK0437100.1 hypothetical protein EV420DRAFT_1487281 [Desarmillaria tabescens]
MPINKPYKSPVVKNPDQKHSRDPTLIQLRDCTELRERKNWKLAYNHAQRLKASLEHGKSFPKGININRISSQSYISSFSLAYTGPHTVHVLTMENRLVRRKGRRDRVDSDETRKWFHTHKAPDRFTWTNTFKLDLLSNVQRRSMTTRIPSMESISSTSHTKTCGSPPADSLPYQKPPSPVRHHWLLTGSGLGSRVRAQVLRVIPQRRVVHRGEAQSEYRNGVGWTTLSTSGCAKLTSSATSRSKLSATTPPKRCPTTGKPVNTPTSIAYATCSTTTISKLIHNPPVTLVVRARSTTPYNTLPPSPTPGMPRSRQHQRDTRFRPHLLRKKQPSVSELTSLSLDSLTSRRGALRSQVPRCGRAMVKHAAITAPVLVFVKQLDGVGL